MPAKRCIKISLAVLCALNAICCRRAAVVQPVPIHSPRQSSPSLSSVSPPARRFDWPAEPQRRLPELQLPGVNRNPWKPKVAERDWKYIVIHHTATSRGSVESIHQTHLARRDRNGNPWLGIGYHFVIGNGNGMRDGEIEPTFRWRQQLHGAHAGVGDYNRQGIGIALIGNFDKHRPTTAQLVSVKRLVAALKTEYGIAARKVVGHSDIRATVCPGRYFPLADVSLSRLGRGYVQQARLPASATFAELNRN